MENVDLIIGLTGAKLNEAIGQIYTNEVLKDQLFSGSQSSDFNGVNFTGEWSIEASPILDLRTPNDLEWKASIKSDGSAALPVNNAFITNLDKLFVSMTTSEGTRKTTVPVKAICTATTSGDKMTINAYSVVIDLSQASPMDQFFAKAIIIPKILESVNKTLNGIKIPIPSFPGVSFTPPEVAIRPNQLIIAANLANQGQPSIPDSLPNNPFFMLLSPELEQAVVNYVVTSNVQGKNFNKHGSKGAAGFSGSYSVTGNVNKASVELTNDPLSLKTTVALSMSASAGISMPFGYIVEAGKVVYEGAKDAANAVADGVTDAANTVADGVSDAANAVADGAKEAAKQAEKVVNPSKW